MKERLLCLILLLFSMSVSHAQSLLPASVQEFLNEHAYIESIKPNRSVPLHEYARFAPTKLIDGQEMVDAFIGIRDNSMVSVLQNSGVVVNCLFDGFVTAQIPLDRLTSVSRMKGVTDVEISKLVQLCTDSTLSVTHTNQVLNGMMYDLPQNYDGTGVIVGIIDNGFDYQHRAFRYSDNVAKSRIVRVYSTQLKTGHPALYNKVIKLPGSVFMNEEILSLTYDNTSTHGTHTASIAAGTHVNGYGGMAPGADIVLCSATNVDGSMSLVEIANCVRYIDAYADSVGKPCVMSLSVSTADGQHDGNDYLTKAISRIVGPGRIFVIAAGNNARMPFYSHKVASESDPINLMFNSYSSDTADSTYYFRGHNSDIWVREPRTNLYYKFHVLDKFTGRIVWESEQFSSSQTLDVSTFQGYYRPDSTIGETGAIKATLKTSSDGSKYGMSIAVYNFLCESYATLNGVKMSRYALGVSIWPRKETPCTIDAWTYVTKSGFGSYKGTVRTLDGITHTNFYSQGTDSCSIGTYAVGDSIISAGAYIARNSYYSYFKNKIITDRTLTVGDIYNLSAYEAEGYGPTGKALPTICAPGVNVVAAGSRYSYFANKHQNTVMVTDDGCYWGVMTGTSMASPTVAGIIALWMEAYPQLSVAEAKDIIAETAIHDSFTNGTNREHFGPNGKIDAYAGMQLVLSRHGFIIGDVDDNGVVNIDDITALIDYMLNGGGSINERAADIDQNGIIQISDLSDLIDLLLYPG